MAEQQPEPGEPSGSSASIVDAGATLSQAMSAYIGSRFGEAESLCRRLLDGCPTHFDALHLLGAVAVQRGDPEAALRAWDLARAVQPQHVELLKNYGVALGLLGRPAEALQAYDEVIALDRCNADAFFNRGNALKELKRLDEALWSYDRAIALRPHDAETLYNRGNVLQELGRLEEALASYQGALAIRPDHAQALNNQGNILRARRRFEEALASYERSLKIRPDANVLNNLGIALADLGHDEAALSSFGAAIALRPDCAEAFYNLGGVLQKQKRLEEALASYNRALAIKPDYPEALINRGVTLGDLNRYEEAVASYDKAIAVRPEFADAFYNRAGALRELNRPDEAAASYAKALAIKPDYPQARFGLCMSELLILYADAHAIVQRRAAYAQRLRTLCDMASSGEAAAALAGGVGSHQPFYLPYQGYDDRDLQSTYGAFVCRIMASRYPQAPLPAPPAMGARLRIGIVSGFFRRHSNWKLPIKGWLSQLNRRRFEIFGYHTDARYDAHTRAAATLCDRFVQGPLSTDRWRAEILADAPHILIYPEIGMDPVVIALAAQRLARVQCNSWGHPTTSGLPTIDYYLSSDLMEPQDGQNHYSEHLVRLPNLSIYYVPGEAAPIPMSRQDLGLRPAATLYWCGQSLYKYLPQFDEVYPRIAAAAGDCQFAFIEHPNCASVTDCFRQRLRRAFEAFGLSADHHCVFLPVLDESHYGAAMSQCDVFLDSIGWSGCNSTLESLPYGLPIVTLPGSLMRARHTAAILRMMGVTATIAETLEDYVACAVRLARDVPWRMAMKAEIAAQRHRVYRDDGCIAGLEQFLDRVGRGTNW